MNNSLILQSLLRQKAQDCKCRKKAALGPKYSTIMEWNPGPLEVNGSVARGAKGTRISPMIPPAALHTHRALCSLKSMRPLSATYFGTGSTQLFPLTPKRGVGCYWGRAGPMWPVWELRVLMGTAPFVFQTFEGWTLWPKSDNHLFTLIFCCIMQDTTCEHGFKVNIAMHRPKGTKLSWRVPLEFSISWLFSV